MDTDGVQVYLLDIEGTTTPVSFVHETLFPHARQHAAAFLRGCAGTPACEEFVDAFAAEHTADRGREDAPPEWQDDSTAARIASTLAYVAWLMDRDRKSTALKALQGRIWQAGYRDGSLVGAIYADVLPAFRRWREQHKTVAIFSSGSILAQKLLFSHTGEGDLTPFIAAYFDTTSGSKKAAASYTVIAHALDHAPDTILFISDLTAELDAAGDAGLRTALCVRAGDPPPTRHPILRDLCI